MIESPATIADLSAGLRNPEEYVRSVLAQMHGQRRLHGEVWVRVGLTGNGKTPHYRIDSRSVRKNVFDDGEYVSFLPLAAFRGAGHKPLVPSGEEPDILHDDHRSQGAMSLDEVAALLGVLRSKRAHKNA